MKKKHKKEFKEKFKLTFLGVMTGFWFYLTIIFAYYGIKLLVKVVNIPAENPFWSNKIIFLLIAGGYVWLLLLNTLASWFERDGEKCLNQLKKFKLKEVK